jgi:molybdate transport system substrate-binding protein|tara:strand:- start:1736 stop:2491 length:756 start_codon:yes stop_codon:yes gene_type:complete
MNVRGWLSRILIASTGLVALAAYGDHARVAVAANFVLTMQQLETVFEAETLHQLTVVSGSTGQLYAQILNEAPYHVFLSADQKRPAHLLTHGSAVSGSQFTYALGKLVLWTNEEKLGTVLDLNAISGDYRYLAIANPRLAPYGIAAREVLLALGQWDSLQSKIVFGQNVSQTYAMVSTRNAEIGLVALSSIVAHPEDGSSILIPENYYSPIRQDAVLLNTGTSNPAAIEFIKFLQSPQAHEIIINGGHGLP